MASPLREQSLIDKLELFPTDPFEKQIHKLSPSAYALMLRNWLLAAAPV